MVRRIIRDVREEEAIARKKAKEIGGASDLIDRKVNEGKLVE